jgi:pyruvate ferredoxin oxidoreductase gamma subunit
MFCGNFFNTAFIDSLNSSISNIPLTFINAPSTGAKGLGSVVAETGKQVQAFAFYGSAKRGASMTAYNRIDDNVILDHGKYMEPDFVFVIDPGLAYTDNITENAKSTTKYIITTHLAKADLIDHQYLVHL